MLNNQETALPDFSHLTPDIVLNLVEESLGVRCTNLCRPLTSYINRVYEAQLEDNRWVIIKFYRPNRWSRDALQDEQDFLTELSAEEIPVIAPLPCANGKTLQDFNGMYFAIFPKKGGRPCEEPDEKQWLDLGRLLARVHLVGARHAPRDRIEIDPKKSTREHLRYILQSDFMHSHLKRQYETITSRIVETITPLFQDVEKIRIHGDCHPANILYRPGESIYLIDFDDMAVGPPVQDLWMLLPGYSKTSQREINLLLEGYETFRPFEQHSLKLIEPLRAMRFIHYTAWCARQKTDGGFSRLAPDWGTESYWKQEIHELEKQHQEIQDSLK